MDIFLMNTQHGLVPMYDSDYENKSRLKIGQVYKATMTMPRNYEFHKKFFSLLRLTFDNLNEQLQRETNINSVEDLLLCLKHDVGLCEVINIDGKQFLKAKSISFAKMDEIEFEQFFQECLFIISTKYLRGVDEVEILENLERYK